MPTLAAGLDLAPGGDEALRRLREIAGVAAVAAAVDGADLDPVTDVTQYRALARDFVLLGRVTGELKRVNLSSPLLKNVPEEERAALAHTAGFVPNLHGYPLLHDVLPAERHRAISHSFRCGHARSPVLVQCRSPAVVACYTGKRLVTQALNLDGLTPDAITLSKVYLEGRLTMEENVNRMDERASELLDWAFEDFAGNMRRPAWRVCRRLGARAVVQLPE